MLGGLMAVSYLGCAPPAEQGNITAPAQPEASTAAHVSPVVAELGEPQLVAASTVVAQADKATRPSNGGIRSDIGVHGQWAIVVREPDGSVVSKTDFNNAFVDSANFLARLLGKQIRLEDFTTWRITLDDASNPPCGNSSGSAFFCLVAEPAFSAIGAHVFKNLEVVVPADVDRQLVLSGSAVSTGGVISEVTTGLSAVTFDNSGGAGSTIFTQHTLAVPIQVEDGQQVQVSVKLCFGAGC
ncbi:MAG: hypothetical protein ACI9MR_003143 [Myxococcota bacterium]|jgi:hypothetical protein